MTKNKYRHEFKYIISDAELVLLRARIGGIMQVDSHTGLCGEYNIRSIYFDDYDDSCYYDNENGTDPREKFRIRIYNGSDERISLECKRKERGKTLKTSCIISKAEFEKIMKGQDLCSFENKNEVLNKFLLKMMSERLKPVVIVDYNRVPYVYQNGNVRITFDKNISSSTHMEQFFEKDISKRPIMPAGYQLLEVKYDEYLPDFIYRALQLSELQQTAYSKYYLCRKFLIQRRTTK